MLSFDDQTLEALGLGGLDPGAKARVVSRMVSSFELLVGSRLHSGLTDDKIEEFEQLMDEGDEEGELRWLAETRPDYREVVQASREELLDVVAEAVTDYRRTSWNGVR